MKGRLYSIIIGLLIIATAILAIQFMIVRADLNDTRATLVNTYARPFHDLEALKAWLAEQPVVQNPGFVIPQTTADYDANVEKGRVTSQNAFSLQKAAARDSYLVSVSPTKIGDGNLFISINIAILENGDVYAFGSDGEEPTFWTNIESIQ